MEESLKRLREEDEERRKNTEAIKTQSQAKLDAAAAERKSKADTEAAEKKIITAREAAIKVEVDAQKAIYSQIKALAIQRDTFSMTADEATLYKLSLMNGVTPAQLELAESILATTAAQTKQNAIMEEGKINHRINDDRAGKAD